MTVAGGKAPTPARPLREASSGQPCPHLTELPPLLAQAFLAQLSQYGTLFCKFISFGICLGGKIRSCVPMSCQWSLGNQRHEPFSKTGRRG